MLTRARLTNGAGMIGSHVVSVMIAVSRFDQGAHVGCLGDTVHFSKADEITSVPSCVALITSDCDYQNQAGRNQTARPQQIEVDPTPPQEREPEPLVHDQRDQPGHRQRR